MRRWRELRVAGADNSLLLRSFSLLDDGCILVLSLAVRSLLGKFCRGLTIEYWIQGGPLTIIITGSDILLSSFSVTVSVLCRWEVIFTCKASDG